MVRHAMTSDLERFRTIAIERALEWYEIARNRYGENMSACSLYLITGFYKARSWPLFNDPASFELVNPRSIKVGRQESIEGGSTTGRYWECTFPVDYRDGPGSNHNGSVNQTVYISGFKIAVREDVLRWWAQGPVRCPHRFARFLKWLPFCRKRASRFRRATETFEHFLSLSPPFHPSDTINRYLLNKDPDALVAVTHDSQWMAMVDARELVLEDFIQEERLERLLSENYSVVMQPEHGKHSISSSMDPFLRVLDQSREICRTSKRSKWGIAGRKSAFRWRSRLFFPAATITMLSPVGEALVMARGEHVSSLILLANYAIYLQHNRWVHPSHKALDC
ncbi:hypothetical protein OG21DRAFT_441561 [Imleria badia]|nr:hypothetical protein OG21DRAFT_441561 [Imleria badia]